MENRVSTYSVGKEKACDYAFVDYVEPSGVSDVGKVSVGSAFPRIEDKLAHEEHLK